MASTNKTTNYELSQFVETDRPAWLTDYNGDMRTIDSTMKAISDVASGASGSISELADRMSTAEGNISTNTNDIAALDARADALEAGAQSTAGTIANIQTEQTAQNLGIEAATELGYNLARPYDSASTYAVGAYVLFQNTLYKCITAVPVGEAFDPTKWLAIKATDEISGNYAQNMIANDYDSTLTYSKGDYCIYNNNLYKCVSDIASPEDFNPAKWEISNVTDPLTERQFKRIIRTAFTPSVTTWEKVTSQALTSGHIYGVYASNSSRVPTGIGVFKNGSTDEPMQYIEGANITNIYLIFAPRSNMTVDFYTKYSSAGGSGESITIDQIV